jgi:hypothetical protein
MNRVIKREILMAILGSLYIFTIPTVAQSGGQYSLTWSTIDGGGGTSSGGSYSLVGTIGQADTGINSGGNLVLSAGFWPGNFGCQVNLIDLTRLAEAWLSSGVLPADLDGNGQVNMADFAILSGWWLDRCPADWPLK